MSGFSLINRNLLMFQRPDFCWKKKNKPYISWLLPRLFGAAAQSNLRIALVPEDVILSF